MGKKIMIIGATGCGKTSLANLLEKKDRPPRKTQDMIYGKRTIDVPGSYLNSPWMYKHIISAALNQASKVIMIVDCTEDMSRYPHGFARLFNCPVIGVITKNDLVEPEVLEDAKATMKTIGVQEPFYIVNCRTGFGIEELEKRLLEEK